MLIVGLTGGIGSGKTTVAKQFKALGVPVYIADEEAKKIMNTSKAVKRKLKVLFGDSAYLVGGELNREYIASLIFKDKLLLQKMNAIVHPEVAEHFKRWVRKQEGPYVIKEVAILFENGGYKDVDKIITVTAPKKERIKRVMERDGRTKEAILAIMKNQWSDRRKVALSDYIIKNTDLEKTVKRVKRVHKLLNDY